MNFDGGEGISYNLSLEKHSLVMSQADLEPCTEPELHLEGEVKCWGFGLSFWCLMHRLPLPQSEATSHNSLLSQPSSFLGTPGAVLGMPQVLLHLSVNPTSHLESMWASRATAATLPQIPQQEWPQSWGIPDPITAITPNLGVSQLQGQQSPQTHGIPAPTTGIPPISQYPLKQKAKVI